MNKRFIILILLLILTISLMIVYNVTYEPKTESFSGIDNDINFDDIVDEIEITLIDEDNKVEIGEMI